MAALVTREFVALWDRRAVDTTVYGCLADTAGSGMVGIVHRAVGTATSPIPYRLSIGPRVGGRTCGPFCELGLREISLDVGIKSRIGL